MSHDLIQVLQNLGHPHVLVLGDLILDRYIWGDAERVSQEAPVILLQADRSEIRLGGAANVAQLLRGLEASVTLAGVVGNDGDGRELRAKLESQDVNCDVIFSDDFRPTTVKERYIGRAQHRHPHQMLRVDREQRTPLDAEQTEQLMEQFLPLIAAHQVVLISDYGKGVCTPEIVARVIAAANEAAVPVIVDPRPGEDYSRYRGATAVTPNRLETSRATGIDVKTAEDAFAAGQQLCEQLALRYAYVTLDSDGIAVVDSQGNTELLRTRKREVYDITGAGDMVLAMIGVATADGIAPADTARLANIAGGLEVEQIGVVTVSREEMLADLLTGPKKTYQKTCELDELAQHVAARRRLGQKIVLTNGCFDLLHVGHIHSLRQAANEGDCLIVAVNSDDSIRRLDKAPDRPLFPEADRAAMLAALDAVDYVLVFNEDTPHVLLDRLRPDLLVKGGTYRHDEIVGWELVEAYGGAVKATGAVPGVSTTQIIQRLRGETILKTPVATRTAHQPERKAG